MEKLKAYISLIRPSHYTKNLLIFAPLFFALKISEIDLVIKCFLATLLFSIVAGVVYILNDYRDIKEDQIHPKKKNRPLAAGTVTKKEAIIFAIVLLFIGLIGSFLLNPLMFAFVLGYLVMNIAYSFGLKHVSLVDIFIVALGFVIRVCVGAIVVNVFLSHWIIILTFLLAIFLALAKRQDDVLIFEQTGKRMRKSIEGYNSMFINSAITVTLAVILVAYIMFTTLPETQIKFNSDDLYLTSVFVLLGILRYLQLAYVENKTDSPVKVLAKDKFMQLVIIAWIATFGILIYF